MSSIDFLSLLGPFISVSTMNTHSLMNYLSVIVLNQQYFVKFIALYANFYVSARKWEKACCQLSFMSAARFTSVLHIFYYFICNPKKIIRGR